MQIKEKSPITPEEAEQISGWIKFEAEEGNMLAVEKETIIEQVEEGKGTVMVDDEGNVVAYSKYFTYGSESGEIEFVEVGSTIVDQEKRRMGIGTAVNTATIKKSKQQFPDAQIIELAENDISKAMLEKMGAIQINKMDLPEEFWIPCVEPYECVHYDKFPDNCPCIAFDVTNIV